jgi:glucan 1,3-beta-glucosidase
VRIYTTSDCDAFKTLLPALKETNTQMIAGLWCTPPDHYDLEIKAVTDNIAEYKDQVLALTVGSEHLYRKELTGAQLAALIKRMQDELKSLSLGTDIPVGFADSWNLVADGTANPAIAQSDIMYVPSKASLQTRSNIALQPCERLLLLARTEDGQQHSDLL